VSAPTKTVQKLLDRHAKLREQHPDAFAAVETSDAPDAKLTAKRDKLSDQLAGVAAKLRERGYTLTHDDSAPVAPASPAAPRSSVTREQLEQAAALRAEGATWNQIREATGTKLGSGTFQAKWEREGIAALPSHSEEFKAARAARNRAEQPAQAEPQASAPEPASKPAARSRAAKKPAAKRTVRRSKSEAKS
jgi:hypothetical protein